MKEIIWIFGNSAAGKDTFINFAIQNSESQKLSGIGLSNKKVVKSEVSTKYIGQYEGDPVTLKRDDIYTEVPELLKTANTVLVKWQIVDSKSQRVNKLLELIPDAEHRIIQICTSKDELSKRLTSKSWWKDAEINNFIDTENFKIQEWIDKLDHKLPITKISGDSRANYSLILP